MADIMIRGYFQVVENQLPTLGTLKCNKAMCGEVSNSFSADGRDRH